MTSTYTIIVATSLITLILLLLSPPDKFYNSNTAWYKKFTWRAWATIGLSLATMLLTIYKQKQDDEQSNNNLNQLNRIEKKNLSILKGLESIGLRFDSNSSKILTKIGSSKHESNIYIKNRITNTETKQKPYLDICRQGIQVDFISDSTLTFNIPYCAINQQFGYNVQLRSTVLCKKDNSYYILANGSERFPKNIVISDNIGKAIEYKLYPVTVSINSIYIFVSGSYTNIDKTESYRIADIFKKSAINNKWVRLADQEDNDVRKYLKSQKIS